MEKHMWSYGVVKRAAYLAAQLHDGQYRKGTKVPFFAHSALVALGVSRYTSDPDLVAAALLHDVMEDTPISQSDIEKETNPRVAQLVREVTRRETHHHLLPVSWKTSREEYVQGLCTKSDDALIIVAADKMTNFAAYFEHIASRNSTTVIHTHFKGTLEDYVWYYKEILGVLTSRIPTHPITEDYRALLQGFLAARPQPGNSSAATQPR